MIMVLNAGMVIAKGDNFFECVWAMSGRGCAAKVEIINKGQSHKEVWLVNKFWVEKRVKLSVSYDASFSTEEILNSSSFQQQYIGMHGYTVVTTK